MTGKIDDGGAAYPGISGADGYDNYTPIELNGERFWISHNQGMSLRDYFAAKALQSYLQESPYNADLDYISKMSYEMADKMIANREINIDNITGIKTENINNFIKTLIHKIKSNKEPNREFIKNSFFDEGTIADKMADAYLQGSLDSKNGIINYLKQLINKNL